MVTGCSGFSVTHNLQFSLPPPVSAGFPYIVYTGAVGWGKVVGKKVKSAPQVHSSSRPAIHNIFCHHLHVRPRSTRHVSGDAAHGATHGVLCTTLRTAHPCDMHTRAQHPGGPWQQPTSHHPSIIERNQFWPPPACELISVRELGASSV